MKPLTATVDQKRDRVEKTLRRLREILEAGLEDTVNQTYARGFLRRLDHIEPKVENANMEAIDIIIRDVSHVIDGWSIRRSETTTPLAMRGLTKKLYGEF
jgi:hypothetical protein